MELPLFIHQEEPLLVYVVNNRLLKFQEHGGYDRSHTRAYYFLYLMNLDKKVKMFIPKELQSYVREELKVEKLLGYPLIGEPDYTPWNLDADLRIIEEKEKPIVLENIIINKSSIKETIKLKGREAVLLFSNITVNARCEWFRELLHHEEIETLDIKFLKEKIEEEFAGKNTRETTKKAYFYLVNYLKFIREEMQKKEIKIEDLLGLSGARVVAFLAELEPELVSMIEIVEKIAEKEIAPNEKLAYYTLIEVYDSYINYLKEGSNQAEKFNQKYNEKKNFLIKIRKEIEERKRKEGI